jgi:large subunit ribosomal protein L5
VAENKETKAGADKKLDPAQEAAKAAAKAAKKQAGAGKRKEKGGSDLRIAAAGETKVSPSATPRLAVLYKEHAVPEIMKQFKFKNAMEVPRLKKVVINCAVKEAVANPKILDSISEDIARIAGQKPIMSRSRKAIATFKVRKGNAVGVYVTLRRARMFEFLDRLMNVAMPRVRDFRGINPKSFDGRGNFSLGLREQIIFPEIDYDKVEKICGMTITIETTAKTNEHARALLTELGMPFRK